MQGPTTKKSDAEYAHKPCAAVIADLKVDIMPMLATTSPYGDPLLTRQRFFTTFSRFLLHLGGHSW
jgi:hypothetical protein